MCGIAGFLGGGHQGDGVDGYGLLERMGNTISHRGPDSGGEWWDSERCIGLSHRRLAILDLSSAGNQPMHSPQGRFVISFNGEIYNHLEIRDSLAAEGMAPDWRGRSDTETLVAGFDAWGIEPTIQRTIGMFAFALWDRERSTLTLGRDRMGEKPLYYGWQDQGPKAAFLFGSELKALRAHPAFQGRVDRDVLALFFRHNYIPAPFSIYRNIFKLAAGNLLEVSLERPEPRIHAYWSMQEVILTGSQDPFPGDRYEAVAELDTLLSAAIRQQMVADVPLGAFLSGGVDSTTVVALMQAQTHRPVKTFTIGFHEHGFNEAEKAQAVAHQLETEHLEMYVTQEDALSVIPALPALYDEPFADSSQIPTYLVARLAHQQVKVSLTGDAGDELFGGYNRYTFAQWLWPYLTLTPQRLRARIGPCLESVAPATWDHLFGWIGGAFPSSLRSTFPGDMVHKGARVMASPDLAALYFELISHWKSPASVVRNAREPRTCLSGLDPGLPAQDGVSRMMALDGMTYLPDDILVKVDRAAMGVSLETRVPMLDHRIVAFAWRLPLNLKLRRGVSKWLLRQVLYRRVPKARMQRPKSGFSLPIAIWLRGPLREWAEELLAADRLRQEGFLQADPICNKWKEHLQGRHNWQDHLWGVLMFQAWVEANRSVT